jgi:hypothetical protein
MAFTPPESINTVSLLRPKKVNREEKYSQNEVGTMARYNTLFYKHSVPGQRSTRQLGKQYAKWSLIFRASTLPQPTISCTSVLVIDY